MDSVYIKIMHRFLCERLAMAYQTAGVLECRRKGGASYYRSDNRLIGPASLIQGQSVTSFVGAPMFGGPGLDDENS
jgi:hypothetical protein